jgi:hypothetical protein
MKKVIITLLMLTILNMSAAFAAGEKKAKKKKVESPVSEDQIYVVPETRPEILIGNSAPPLRKYSGKRPENQYYVGIVRGALTYKLPALNNGTTDFKANTVGVSLSKKTADEIHFFKGNYEIGGEWQAFKRDLGVFSQKLNIFQLNFFQNFDLAWSLKHSVFFSAGLGVSPMYLTAEQSVFGDSVSKIGGMGLIKFDFIVPIKNSYEFDFGLKGGWGNVGGHEMFLSNLSLGLNFE